MQAQRKRRLFAVSAAGLLMAGGIAVGTAGTASASDMSYGHNHSSYSRYDNDHGRGWWNNDNCGNGRGWHNNHDGYYNHGNRGYDHHNNGYDRGDHHGNRGGDHGNRGGYR